MGKFREVSPADAFFFPEESAAYIPQPPDPGSSEISPGERLLNQFNFHERQERKFTERYREIANRSRSPLVRFLLWLIITDEAKHHELAQVMASNLKSSLDWTKPEEDISTGSGLREEKDELLNLTEEFIKVEKDGIKDYKKLKQVAGGYFKGSFVLLIQTIIRDSEKHVEILEFLRQKLKET